MTGAIFEATVPYFTYDFAMTPAYYDQLGGWMEELGLIETRPDSSAR